MFAKTNNNSKLESSMRTEYQIRLFVWLCLSNTMFCCWLPPTLFYRKTKTIYLFRQLQTKIPNRLTQKLQKENLFGTKTIIETIRMLYFKWFCFNLFVEFVASSFSAWVCVCTCSNVYGILSPFLWNFLRVSPWLLFCSHRNVRFSFWFCSLYKTLPIV